MTSGIRLSETRFASRTETNPPAVGPGPSAQRGRPGSGRSRGRLGAAARHGFVSSLRNAAASSSLLMALALGAPAAPSLAFSPVGSPAASPVPAAACATDGFGTPIFSMSISSSSVVVGESFVVSWCDPSYSGIDRGFGVDTYRLYYSEVAEGGFVLFGSYPPSTLAVQLSTDASDAGKTYRLFVRAEGTCNTFVGPQPCSEDTATTTVTVTQPSVSVTSFTANPSAIALGGSSTLTWATAGATSVAISPGFASVPVNGSLVVRPTQTTEYTLTATGAGGSATAKVTVTVSAPQVSLSPSSITTTVGASVPVTVTVTPAQATAVTVTLASSSASVVTVPATVTVAAGGGSAQFAVTAVGSGSATVTARLPQGLGGGSASTAVTVGCPSLSAPQIVSAPTGAVTAGSSFTVAWTGAGTSYEVSLSSNAGCTSPTVIATEQTSITVPTASGSDADYCVKVRAVGAGGCASAQSSPVTVHVEAPPASFVVTLGQTEPATASQGGTVGDDRVVLRNVGSGPGNVTFVAEGGLFTVIPASASSVSAGAEVTVTVRYLSGATSVPGTHVGRVVARWTEGGAERTASVPITLQVLAAPPQDSAGSKLLADGAADVHFRQASGSNPGPQTVTIRNGGTVPIRLAVAIGPGGSWLSVSGDTVTTLQPGASRAFEVRVDRSRRAASDGTPPLQTGLRFENVDGNPEDGVGFAVYDEEPPTTSPGTGRPDLGAQEFSLVVGSSVSATGAGGTKYLSDGWIRNRGADAARIDLYYTPGGADGETGAGVKKATFSLLPYSTYRLSDFVAGIFNVTGSGHVEVRSDRMAQLSVRATADAVLSKSGVTSRYGAEIPVLVSGQGIRRTAEGDSVAYLPGVGDAVAGLRTNVILAETCGKLLNVRVRLYDPAGTQVGQVDTPVQAYSKAQVDYNNASLFPTTKRYQGGTIEVRPVSGEGCVAAFATVIDNASQSFATRVGQVVPPTGAAGARPVPSAITSGYLPAASHSIAANNSFYTTRLTVGNIFATPANLDLTYLEDRSFGGRLIGPRRLTIPARAGSGGPPATTIADLVKDHFGLSTNSAGMVRFEGDISKVTIASDTTTPIDLTDPSKGTSIAAVNPAPGNDLAHLGLFYTDSPEVLDPAAGRLTVTHPAVEEGRAYRTNLILAELAGASAKVRVKLVPRESGGAVLASKDFDLAPNERYQSNRVVRVLLDKPDDAVEVRDVEIVVEHLAGNGKVLAVLTRIDNNPLSKRADIYTLGGSVSGIGVGR